MPVVVDKSVPTKAVDDAKTALDQAHSALERAQAEAAAKVKAATDAEQKASAATDAEKAAAQQAAAQAKTAAATAQKAVEQAQTAAATAQKAFDAAQQAATAAKVPAPPTPEVATGTHMRVNTNLEQVSDWLTKILIGVGLTQLQQLPAQIRHLGQDLSGVGRGQSNANTSFAEALVVYFAIVGFLFAYLLTRVYIQKVFRRGDEDGH